MQEFEEFQKAQLDNEDTIRLRYTFKILKATYSPNRENRVATLKLDPPIQVGDGKGKIETYETLVIRASQIRDICYTPPVKFALGKTYELNPEKLEDLIRQIGHPDLILLDEG